MIIVSTIVSAGSTEDGTQYRTCTGSGLYIQYSDCGYAHSQSSHLSHLTFNGNEINANRKTTRPVFIFSKAFFIICIYVIKHKTIFDGITSIYLKSEVRAIGIQLRL